MTLVLVADDDVCGLPYVPAGLVYPYSCALKADHDGAHLHVGAGVAWPRQPELPGEDFSEEWTPLVPALVCQS